MFSSTIKFATISLFALLIICTQAFCQAEDRAEQYEKQIVPLFQKYCVACHNDDDLEGKMSLDSYKSLLKGSENGIVVIAGDSKSSRLVRVLTGQAEPKMPPKDEPAPSQAEIETLIAWIDAGAIGPQGEEPRYVNLVVPDIQPVHNKQSAITDVAWSPDGQTLAVARFQQVELLGANDLALVKKLSDQPGKVNRVAFSKDGQLIVTASGITGLKGVARIYRASDGELLHEFEGHRDTIYGIALSHDNKTLATSSYDRTVLIWDVDSGKVLQKLTGHNDAVYDLDFNKDSTVLASASGDETLKLWLVANGERLDTLGQPLEEQFVARFSPDDKYVAGAGCDNRIRLWSFVSKTSAMINPLVFARFGHDQPIVDLAFSRDSKILVSTSEDRSVKVWDTASMRQIQALENQPAICAAVDISPAGNRIVVGRLDGSLELIDIKTNLDAAIGQAEAAVAKVIADEKPLQQITEQEPNDNAETAQQITLPAKISGTIFRKDAVADQDLFRFQAKAGEQIVLETNAQRQQSPLDTKVEVLDESGEPIPRVLLRAVRDSYFTFRGKDSFTSDDFRVQNWQEMELNELLYADGEVVKLWLYPRGPDSGFKVYPGKGNRWTYLDTTASAHALQSPCFIVEPVAPGSEILPNGLPTFTIYYENDDDSLRRYGSDSYLLFTAPHDGSFVAKIADVRGFQGENYKYDFTIRAAKPSFKVSLQGANPTVSAGSGKEFSLVAERFDGFTGEIRVDIEGLPPGFHATSPLVIQAEQTTALGTIYADKDAPMPTAENSKNSKLTATALINDQEVSEDVNNFGEIKLGEKPKVVIKLAGSDAKYEEALQADPAKPLELTISPGETITAKVFVERNGIDTLVKFGGDDSGRNLPFGVFVDNIGLNGLMIVEGQNERTFFITAAKWVPDQDRQFYLRAENVDGECSLPVILRVRSK